MDRWNEATWLNRANLPTLRAVSGRSLRVLPRHDDSDFTPTLDPEIEPDGIRVLVVSDDVLARRGVLAALDDQPGMIVVGDRRPGPDVAAAVASRDPDVLLLHGVSGDEAAPTLAAVRKASRTVKVLSIGARTESSTMELSGDVCGQLPACATPEEVCAAVRMAAAGYQLSRTPQHRASTWDGRAVALQTGLTERECDVLSLVAKGMSNAEIATELTLSEHTVKSHVQNMLGKLRLRNRIHAVIYAFDAGIAHPAGN
jgi:DNA-binding NarL/FixJ family response regulator